MFERFTDRARRAVVLAQEEARSFDHNYIGTEHVLLGLVHEGEGVAAKALDSLGISLEQVRREVEQIIGRGEDVPGEHVPFTPRAKKVLELALREALQMNHNYIGTEHILLGLVREGEGVAAQVLTKLGADLDRVRAGVIELLAGVQPRTGVSRLAFRPSAEFAIGQLVAELLPQLRAVTHADEALSEELASAVERVLRRPEGLLMRMLGESAPDPEETDD